MLTGSLICLNLLLLTASVFGQRDHPLGRSIDFGKHIKYEAETETAFWTTKAQEILKDKLASADRVRTQKAKNIIMFLGDGMSVHTIAASRNFLGDASEQLYFDKFPFVGLSKTYCVNRQVPDSACTATAYLGGVKGNYGTIGVNANVDRYNCEKGTNPGYFVESIAKWAQDAGKDAGLVTTARVTHASPAGVYAHTANRDWENDAAIKNQGCSAVTNVDIARQLVEWPVGKQLKVVLGGGRQNFINTTVNDEEGDPGLRTDGRNLIKDWLADKAASKAKAHYVWSRKGLSLLDLNATDYLLGLFSRSHCPYHGDLKRDHLELADPSLSEMTEAAVKILQRKQNGFFLFVEGAQIDMAHHDNFARRALEDTIEFAKAVQIARELTSEEDTLIIVTADHSHTMTINGNPYRDQNIFGLSNIDGDDGLPYTILSYANGPSFNATYSKADGRKEVTNKITNDPYFEYASLAPLESETHGGDDVGVFASGPYAQHFVGSYEQTNIPAMMAKAANIGPFANL